MQIKEIGLLTGDLNQTKRFYHQQLGLEIKEETDRSTIFAAGASLIKFTLEENIHPVYHFAFSIPHNHLEEGIDWLKTKAELIYLVNGEIVIDFPNWKAQSAYFYDLSGNILELIARFPLNNASSNPFSPDSLLDISEIAVATDDVTSITEMISRDYSIPFFSRQKPQSNFAAMGNDEGLLIFSSTNRNWYPTEVPAVEFPVTIKVLQNGLIEELNFNQRNQHYIY